MGARVVVQVAMYRASGTQTGVPVPRHVLTMETKNPIWWSTPLGPSTRTSGNAVNVVLNGTLRDASDQILIPSLAQPVVQALWEPLGQVPLAVVQVVVCRVSGIQTGVPVPRHVLTMEMKNPIWWSTPPGTSTRPAGNAVNVVLNGTSRDAPDHMLIQSLAQPVVQALREPLEQVPIQPLVQALAQARGWPLRALAAV